MLLIQRFVTGWTVWGYDVVDTQTCYWLVGLRIDVFGTETCYWLVGLQIDVFDTETYYRLDSLGI